MAQATCKVEEYFGLAQIVDMVPFLYHMGDWKDTTRGSSPLQLLATGLASLAINLLHKGGFVSCGVCMVDVLSWSLKHSQCTHCALTARFPFPHPLTAPQSSIGTLPPHCQWTRAPTGRLPTN